MATSIVVKHHFKYTVVLPNDTMVTVAQMGLLQDPDFILDNK